LKIAYLVNQYPKVSHSFIRREILALERLGLEVQRLALRGWEGPLPDEEDRREREQTRYVLRGGPLALVVPTLLALLRAPACFFTALRLSLKMARESDRALAYYLIYLAEACSILAWLRASGTCQIHAHFGTNSTDVAMLVNALGGPPYSFTVHGPEEFLRPIGLREKIRRSAFVVAISSFGRSQLCLWSQYGDWPKIRIVHCGLEVILRICPKFARSCATPYLYRADIDTGADQVAAWTQDILVAVEALRQRTGVGRVCLLGFRLVGRQNSYSWPI